MLKSTDHSLTPTCLIDCSLVPLYLFDCNLVSPHNVYWILFRDLALSVWSQFQPTPVAPLQVTAGSWPGEERAQCFDSHEERNSPVCTRGGGRGGQEGLQAQPELRSLAAPMRAGEDENSPACPVQWRGGSRDSNGGVKLYLIKWGSVSGRFVYLFVYLCLSLYHLALFLTGSKLNYFFPKLKECLWQYVVNDLPACLDPWAFPSDFLPILLRRGSGKVARWTPDSKPKPTHHSF